MNKSIYFHTNYTSSRCDYYTKVSVEISGRGMFCVVCNKKDGSLMHQQYGYCIDAKKRARRCMGLDRHGLCEGYDELDGAWINLDDKTREEVHKCTMSLPNAFRALCKSQSFTNDEKNEICTFVAGMQSKVNSLFTSALLNGECESEWTEEEKANMDSWHWEDVELRSMGKFDLASIMHGLQQSIDGETRYNGIRYRVVGVAGGMKLQCLKPNEVVAKEKTQRNEPATPARKTMKMALMVDNSNLTEFVNGCFYKIVAGDKDGYVRLLNDRGEERLVRKERVSMADIYVEPPASR